MNGKDSNKKLLSTKLRKAVTYLPKKLHLTSKSRSNDSQSSYNYNPQAKSGDPLSKQFEEHDTCIKDCENFIRVAGQIIEMSENNRRRKSTNAISPIIALKVSNSINIWRTKRKGNELYTTYEQLLVRIEGSSSQLNDTTDLALKDCSSLVLQSLHIRSRLKSCIEYNRIELEKNEPLIIEVQSILENVKRAESFITNMLIFNDEVEKLKKLQPEPYVPWAIRNALAQSRSPRKEVKREELLKKARKLRKIRTELEESLEFKLKQLNIKKHNYDKCSRTMRALIGVLSKVRGDGDRILPTSMEDIENIVDEELDELLQNESVDQPEVLNQSNDNHDNDTTTIPDSIKVTDESLTVKTPEISTTKDAPNYPVNAPVIPNIPPGPLTIPITPTVDLEMDENVSSPRNNAMLFEKPVGFSIRRSNSISTIQNPSSPTSPQLNTSIFIDITRGRRSSSEELRISDGDEDQHDVSMGFIEDDPNASEREIIEILNSPENLKVEQGEAVSDVYKTPEFLRSSSFEQPSQSISSQSNDSIYLESDELSALLSRSLSTNNPSEVDKEALASVEQLEQSLLLRGDLQRFSLPSENENPSVIDEIKSDRTSVKRKSSVLNLPPYDHKKCSDCSCVYSMADECIMQLATVQQTAQEGTRRFQRLCFLVEKMKEKAAILDSLDWGGSSVTLSGTN